MTEKTKKGFFIRWFEALITEHDRFHTFGFTIPHFHKVLGFTCLGHFFYRFFLAFTYGSMFFDPDSIITWCIPALHSMLSLSSFIFPVPTRRFGSKPIIWKELQLHNILFSVRSCILFWLWLYQPCSFQSCSNDHLFMRMIVIMATHYVADLVTNAYQDLGRTTTRDMPWGADVPDWIPTLAKKYYAICQLLATTALLAQGGQMLDAAFSILFPIQISTFLMTLVRKNLITSTQWHLYYALSLGIVFWLPISAMVRAALGSPVPGYHAFYKTPVSTVVSVLHMSLGPLAAYLRMAFRVNKHVVFVIITGMVILLAEVERQGSLASALAALQRSAANALFGDGPNTDVAARNALVGSTSSAAPFH